MQLPPIELLADVILSYWLIGGSPPIESNLMSCCLLIRQLVVVLSIAHKNGYVASFDWSIVMKFGLLFLPQRIFFYYAQLNCFDWSDVNAVLSLIITFFYDCYRKNALFLRLMVCWLANKFFALLLPNKSSSECMYCAKICSSSFAIMDHIYLN